MKHPASVFARIPALLRRFELRIGAARPGRSLWVWAIPVVTLIVTFVLCLIVAVVGQLGWGVGVPLALFGALYTGTTAVVNLTSGMPDAQDADEGGGGGGGGQHRGPARDGGGAGWRPAVEEPELRGREVAGTATGRRKG